MPSKEEIIVNNMQYEVERIKENPIYQDYLKLKAVINQGKMMEQMIGRKVRTINGIIQRMRQVEEEPEELDQEEYLEMPQPKKRTMPKMRREDYKEPDERRVRELDAKVQKAAEMDTTPKEMGLDDDLPGLPEDLRDFENEA